MSLTDQEILSLYVSRRAQYEILHGKMQIISDIYNGRAKVPLPDMDRNELPSIPNLLAQGVDQMAGRITSITPQVAFASMKPGQRKYDRRAMDAARTINGWWQADRLPLKMSQRGKHYVAYGMAPVVMGWNFKEHRPTWDVRHPMTCYPSDDITPGNVTPTDCIFAYQKTLGWLAANGYGQKIMQLTGKTQFRQDTIVSLIEYVDDTHTVLIAAGHFSPDMSFMEKGSFKGVVLERYAHLAGSIPVVVPIRLTLDAMTGQFDNMIGMYFQQAKLQALEMIGVEKGVFPETWLIGRANESPQIIDGPHDGRTGLVNIVTGGDIREITPQPGYMTPSTIDRMERAQRTTAGIPAEFGGESTTGIRTGRRGDAVLSGVIDAPIADAQRMFAFSLEQENTIAINLAKRIDGTTQRTLSVGSANARRPVTYIASETFETVEHVVSNPAAGTDSNSLVLGMSQRVGVGTMSRATMMMNDPMIDDPEVEHDLIIAEGLEQALVQSFQQQASSGQIPPLTVAKVLNLVKMDKMEIGQAMQKVADEAAAEAAKQQEGQQGPPTADAAGAAPTVQALAGGVQPPEQTMPGVQNLGQMLAATRRPAMTVTPYRGQAQGAM